MLVAIGVFVVDNLFFRAALYGDHLAFEVYVDAPGTRCLGEPIVEIGPFYLPGPGPAFGELVFKEELAAFFATHKSRPRFFLEIQWLYGFAQSRFGEMFHTARQQAFPDLETGEFFFFQDRDLVALLFQVRSRDSSGRAGPNNQHIDSLHIQAFFTF
ncbi:hypothetical protein D3C86_1678580 [compost metagenome]